MSTDVDGVAVKDQSVAFCCRWLSAVSYFLLSLTFGQGMVFLYCFAK